LFQVDHDRLSKHQKKKTQKKSAHEPGTEKVGKIQTGEKMSNA
jgi:hypothetical protein